MKKIVLTILFFAVTVVVFAQTNARVRSEDTNVPEIDNLSGLKPDGEDLEATYGVTGLSEGNTGNTETGTVSEMSTTKEDDKGSINFEKERSLNEIEVYPNPATDYLTVISGFEVGTIRILNLLGQELVIFNITGNTMQLDIAELKEGIYFVSIESGNEKIVKKLKVLY